MAPRAMWTGQLRLSLVSFGVRMYAATESGSRVAMNQLHRDCHQRLKNQTVCPVHGPVHREDIVKGYQYEKDSYVIIEPDDLESIKLSSTKTIDLIQFVDENAIDDLYVDSPYFIGPDGPVAEEAYRVIHEAMKRDGKVGIGKLVMSGRERIIALKPYGKGFLLTTLRYAGEVRSGTEYFADVTNKDVDEEQVALAQTIMSSKTSEFDPSEFTDNYAAMFFDVVKRKLEGAAPIQVREEEAPTTFNFMDALQQSVEAIDEATSKGATKKKPPARSVGGKKKSGRKQA